MKTNGHLRRCLVHKTGQVDGSDGPASCGGRLQAELTLQLAS